MNYIGAIYVIGAILLKKNDHIKYALTISGTGCFFDFFRMIFQSSNSSWAYIRFIEFIVRFLAFLFEIVWIAGVYCYFKQEEAIRAIKSSNETGGSNQPSTSANPPPAATAAPKPPVKNTPVIKKPAPSGVKSTKEPPKALSEKLETSAVQKRSRETPETDQKNKPETSSANKSQPTESPSKVDQKPFKLTDNKPDDVPKADEQSEPPPASAKMPNDQNVDEFSADVDDAEKPLVKLPTVDKNPENKSSANDQKIVKPQVNQTSKPTSENSDEVSSAVKKSNTLPKENLSTEQTTKPSTSDKSPTEQETDKSPADDDAVERKSTKPAINDKEPEKNSSTNDDKSAKPQVEQDKSKTTGKIPEKVSGTDKKSKTLPASGKTPTKTASLPKEKTSSKETTKPNLRLFKSASALVGPTGPSASDKKKSEQPPTSEESPTEEKTDESPAVDNVVEQKSAKPLTTDKEPAKESSTNDEKVGPTETSTSDGKESERPRTSEESPTEQKTDETPDKDDVVKPE